MLSFTNYLKNIILNNGYINLDAFFSLVSNYYYSNTFSIGSKSDFITAPEVSQMFGEMIGIHITQNCKNKFSIVELGPGNGSMIIDIIRCLQQFPFIIKKLDSIFLLEISPILKKRQKKFLTTHYPDIKFQWINNIEELHNIENQFVIIANEFFDALPIKQFYRQENKLYERVIMVNKKNDFVFGYKECLVDIMDPFRKKIFFELSPVRKKYVDSISELINSKGGYGIIIDYGYEKMPAASTLQAVLNHKKVDFLSNIGSADITSLVDFGTIKAELDKNAIHSTIKTQGYFLKSLGIEVRAASLIKKGASREKIMLQLDRLIGLNQMGNLFKVLTTEPINL